jgi:hypothetical protein
MTQTPAILSAAEPIPADAFVLEGHELRDGVELADTSRFGDDIWHLHPINHQDHLNRNILSFPTLPDEFRAVTKELFYALLVGDLPPGEIRLKQFSIRTAFTGVKKFLDWAHNQGHRSLASLTSEVSSPTNSGCFKPILVPHNAASIAAAHGCSGSSAQAYTPTDSVSTHNACTRGRSTTANRRAASRTPPTAFLKRSSARS